jgi:hypothetical protein
MDKNRKTIIEKNKYIDLIISIIESTDFKASFLTNHHFNYNEINYWGVTFYDVITNNEMNKLIKKISKLKNNEYKKKVYFQKPRIKKINYFRMQYDNSGYGILGEIDLLKDNFIKKINIGYTQITNNEAIIEYKISFPKIFSIIDLSDFLKENRKIFNKCLYSTYYYTDRYSKSEFIQKILKYISEAFIETLQCKIGTMTNFGLGSNYSLPAVIIQNVSNELFNDESLKNNFLSTLIKINDQYLYYDVLFKDGLKIDLLFTGHRYTPLSFLGIASKLRLKFYYFLFFKIEHKEINSKMNKYFGSNNRTIKSSDYKWLVNKIRSFRDNSLHQHMEKDRENYFKDWIQYKNGNEVDIDLLKGHNSKNFELIYIECLNHIKTLYSLQKENLIIRIATWTLLLTVIGIIVTFLLNV